MVWESMMQFLHFRQNCFLLRCTKFLTLKIAFSYFSQNVFIFRWTKLLLLPLALDKIASSCFGQNCFLLLWTKLFLLLRTQFFILHTSGKNIWLLPCSHVFPFNILTYVFAFAHTSCGQKCSGRSCNVYLYFMFLCLGTVLPCESHRWEGTYLLTILAICTLLFYQG